VRGLTADSAAVRALRSLAVSCRLDKEAGLRLGIIRLSHEFLTLGTFFLRLAHAGLQLPNRKLSHPLPPTAAIMGCFTVVAWNTKGLIICLIVTASLLQRNDVVYDLRPHPLPLVPAIQIHTPGMLLEPGITLGLPLASISTPGCRQSDRLMRTIGQPMLITSTALMDQVRASMHSTWMGWAIRHPYCRTCQSVAHAHRSALHGQTASLRSAR
jgi:hypothetical protein